MQVHEYTSLDAVGLRELILAGEVTASEVEAVARHAIESANPDLNALTQPLFEESLTSESGGPLGGVPFLIKDSGPCARGVSFTLGSRSIRGAVAALDHDLMARFRSAGLATPGQGTAPELGSSFARSAVDEAPAADPRGLTREVVATA